MKIADITLADMLKVAEDYSLNGPEPVVTRVDSVNLQGIVTSTILGVPMNRYVLASDVRGAFAFGVEVGLKLAEKNTR